LAFNESRHPVVCDLGGDPILGCCCRHFAPFGHILETLNFF